MLNMMTTIGSVNSIYKLLTFSLGITLFNCRKSYLPTGFLTLFLPHSQMSTGEKCVLEKRAWGVLSSCHYQMAFACNLSCLSGGIFTTFQLFNVKIFTGSGRLFSINICPPAKYFPIKCRPQGLQFT